MCLVTPPPLSAPEPVIDVLHRVPISDPYRWLEDQNAPRTRLWIDEQTCYTQTYLDLLPARSRIRERVRTLLDVETHDSFVKAGNRFFFRKRLRGQEQAGIYFREGIEGEDQLLLAPSSRNSGDYTAIKPIRASKDGLLLLYEVKQGGERPGVFELFDVENRRTLPDRLPHGQLRGFAFAPDNQSFYYSLERTESADPFYRAAYQHVLGSDAVSDKLIFEAGRDEKLRLNLVASQHTLGILVQRFLDKTYTDFYIWRIGSASVPLQILWHADYLFVPRLLPGRIFALIDHNAPNRRIVEVQARKQAAPVYTDVVSETNVPIRGWSITANHFLVSYARSTGTEISVFDFFGKRVGEIPCALGATVRIVVANRDDDELLIERETFFRPKEVMRCQSPFKAFQPLIERAAPISSEDFDALTVSFSSNDGTSVPMVLVGRRDVLASRLHPTIITAYGGFGVSLTPQFSALAVFLMEHGCLLALPQVRGGSEFGAVWHEAAKRSNRQRSIDDFLSAAEWLINNHRTTALKLAIFGGSNSGLLVAAAMTQRPDLFRAVLCIAPMLDMLRYHLFDGAHVWKDEFGTADDANDFRALLAYSPYHAVRQHTRYPATMIVSGDRDTNCSGFHARKMVASLQSANSSSNPILLDYSPHRGHSPVLPLTMRVNALTDRLSFLCDQIGLAV